MSDDGSLHGSATSDPLFHERLVELSRDTLAILEQIAASARSQLDNYRPPGASTFAAVNTLTTGPALRALVEISEDRQRDLTQLCIEPAIARVVVSNDEGQKQTIVICRRTPHVLIDGALVASYRAPIGRLAATGVGLDHQIETPRGSLAYDVLEIASLRPVQTVDGWDSVYTVVQALGNVPLTLTSLRDLLRSFGLEGEDLDLLDKLIEQDRSTSIVREGVQRSVIEKMGLRDRPLLDMFQDSIFRLPLSSRIAILGPPGTGKTTTLIKRLGLKLDIEYLDDNEKTLVTTHP